RAVGPPGTSLRCTAGSWQASLSAIESACPRTIAASAAVGLREGSGSRPLPPAAPRRPAAEPASRAGFLAIAPRQPLTARLNGSVGLSLAAVSLGLMLDDIFRVPWSERCGCGQLENP